MEINDTQECLVRGIDNISAYAIFLIDHEGKVLSWNSGAQRIMKYDAGEIIGHNLSELYTREENKKEAAKKNIEFALEKGSGENLGWRVREDGSYFWCRETISRVSESQNSTARFLIILQDLSKQKEKERVTTEWSEMFEYTDWSLAAIDPVTTRFKYVNQSFARMHGYALADLEDLDFLELISNTYRDKFISQLEQTIVKGHSLFRSEHLHKSGKSIPLVIESAAIRNEKGVTDYILLNIHQIDEYDELDVVTKGSEEKYWQLFEQASEGIFIADLNGKYTDVNSAGLKMLGYVKEEIVGKAIMDIIPEEEKSKLSKAKESMLKENIDVEEYHLKKKDGTYLPVEVSAKILPDGRWQGFVRDISERIKAQELMKNSEQKFRNLLEDAHDAVVIVNEKGEIEFTNKNLLKWFGYTIEELNCKPIETLLPDRFRSLHIGNRFQFMANPYPRPMGIGIDLFARRKDGSEFPIDVSLSPIEVEGRVSVAAFIRDLSDRKRFEAQQKFLADIGKVLTQELDLKLNNQLLKFARLITPFLADFCVIYYFDNNKISVKAVSHVNAKNETVLHQMAEDFFSTPGSCPYDPENPVEDMKPMLLSSLSETFLKTFFNRKEKTEYLSQIKPKSLLLLPLIARKKLVGVLMLGMSDSDRQYSQHDVNFSELVAIRIQIAIDNIMLFSEAQKATKARQNILAIVSHDLKNAFTSIKATLQMVPKLIEKKENDNAVKLLGIAGKSSAYIERLINDLLDFSRIQEGKLSLEIKQVNVKELVETVINSLSGKPQEKEIEFFYELPKEDLVIECDAVRVSQILGNVLGNAFKFTPSKGRVTLQIKDLHNSVQFIIADTGPGIPKEKLPYIFDRFWQVKETAHLGAGLGLSIAKGLVDAHNGTITAESQAGVGTTFRIELPKIYADKLKEN